MSPLYDLYVDEIAISALDNVPKPRTRKGRRRAQQRVERNARRSFETGADWGVLTETWHPFLKEGIYAAAPPWARFHTARGQSVTVWWDSRRYNAVRKVALRLHGPLWSQWDTRYAFLVLLEDRETGRRRWVGGVHTAPLKRRFPGVYRVGVRAHDAAYAVLNGFAADTGYPIELAGDWNDVAPAKRFDSEYGARSYGKGIIRVVLMPGVNATFRFGATTVIEFDLESDHEGELVSATGQEVVR